MPFSDHSHVNTKMPVPRFSQAELFRSNVTWKHQVVLLMQSCQSINIYTVVQPKGWLVWGPGVPGVAQINDFFKAGCNVWRQGRSCCLPCGITCSVWQCSPLCGMFAGRNKPSKLKQKGPLLLKALLVRKETALRVNSACLELLETSERAGCGRK